MMILTGRLVFRERYAASGAPYGSNLPPKPPPISCGVRTTCDSEMPSALAVPSRTSTGPWVLHQMWTRPSFFQWTVVFWGSMYP